jgi:hypothetical protein
MDIGAFWTIGAGLVMAIFAGGGAYAAIRADLKGLHEFKREITGRVDKFEDRFNAHIEKGLTHGNAQA